MMNVKMEEGRREKQASKEKKCEIKEGAYCQG
jgi:hypothetical protein